MKPSHHQTLIHHVRSWLASQPNGAGPDQELLDRFVQQRDDQSFRLLVQRHGAMVLRVCHRQLQDAGEAEDAFQATFLVLARRAQAIRSQHLVGPWLYSVAYRVARRLRQQQRPVPASDLDQTPATPIDDRGDWQETVGVLDEELHGLAEKYRMPLVLHYLQGQPQQQVAEQLGWSLRTTKRHLAEGRELLRQRLVRRGLEMAMVPLALELSVSEVPAALVQQTATAAARDAAGGGSAKVLALVDGVLGTMTINKLKLAVMLTLVLALTALGAGAVYLHALGQETTVQKPAVAKEPAAVGKAPPVDQYGDPLPEGAIARLGTVRFRHPTGLKALSFASDGKTVLSLGESGDSALRVWDTASGRELSSSSRKFWSASAFSADGKFLAVEAGKGMIVLWDTATDKELHRFEGHTGHIGALAFSRDGQILASAGGGSTYNEDGSLTTQNGKPGDITIRLWNAVTGKQLRHWNGHEGAVEALAFAPDGKSLASGAGSNYETKDYSVRVWEVASGKELHRLKGHESSVTALAYTADSMTLVSAGGTNLDHTLRLWDTATGKERGQLTGNEHAVTSLVLSPNGKVLAGGEGSALYLWDAATGKELHRLRGHTNQCQVAFSPDGKLLVSGGGDHTIRLWEVVTGREVIHPWKGHEGDLHAVAVSPDSKLVVTGGGDSTLRLWEPATGRMLGSFEGVDDQVAFAAFLQDGKTLLSAGGGKDPIRLWDVASRVPLRRFGGEHHGNGSFCLSRNGRLLVSSLNGKDATVHLWDVASGKELHQFTFEEEITHVSPAVFSPDGKTLAVVAYKAEFLGIGDPKVRLLDVATGKEWPRLEGQPGWSENPRFTADGKSLLTTGDDDTGDLLWELATGKVRRAFKGPTRPRLSGLLSPDGRMVAAAEHGEICLRDAATGKELSRLKGHRGSVTSIVFSADGKQLVSASADTTALVWDLAGITPAKQPVVDLTREQLVKWWNDLAGDDAPKAFQAIEGLSAGPAQAVPFLNERLQPVPLPDSGRLDRLIDDLDSKSFEVRETAGRELDRLGDVVEPALRKVLEGKPSLEVRQRVEQLLTKLENHLLPGEELRTWRAMEVLEQIGSQEARQVLEKLAKGMPGVRLTREAAAALGRLAEQKRGS